MTRALLVVAGALAAGYLGLCGLLFALQRSMLFPAPKLEETPQGASRLLVVPGGTRVLWREGAPGGPVVVHFHGNGEQVAGLSWLAEAFAARGVAFAAVEYPGYPGAPGQPSEASLLAAGEAGVRHVVEGLGVARERLVLQGQSLGSGVAVALAAQGWGTRLVLLSPYTSLPDVAARALPAFPVRWLMRDRFDSAALAPGLRLPTLVVHGTRDEVVPFDLGQALAGRIPGGTFFPVEGAGHNELWDRGGALEAVLRFVTAAAPGAGAGP